MKVVFIAGHEFTSDKKNGSHHTIRRNYDLWAKAFGKENIYVITFSNEEYESDIPNIMYFPKHRNRIEQMKNALLFRNGYNAKTEKLIKKYISDLEPDIIYFDHSFTGRLLKNLNINSNVKIVTFMHNVERDYVWDKVTKENILYFPPFISYSMNEKYLMEHSDIIINFNHRDALRVKELYGRDSDFLLPITYSDIYDENFVYQEKSKELKLMWVGTNFGPNTQGLFWFIENVLPAFDDVHLDVLGFETEKLREKICSPKVNVIGTVDDLAPYYYQADAVVQPIFYGGGMKTKTAQIMMYGKAMFATDEALEGYACEESEHTYRVNTAEEYIEAIKEFKNSDYKKYYDDVRDIFLVNHCTEKKENEFIEFIRKSI